MAQFEDTKYGRTDVFQIVDKFPEGYIIWNIGRANFPHECYIPLAQRVSLNKHSLEYYHIKTDTLKALKVESEEVALYLMNYEHKHKTDSVNSINFDEIVKRFKEEKK